MKSLQLAFLGLLLLLGIPTAYLVHRTYRNLTRDAYLTSQKAAENVGISISHSLEGYLKAEQKRPPWEYRYVYASESRGSEGATVMLSPLSRYPQPSDVPGILGYFQIDPAQVFSTPFLPTRNDPVVTLLSYREEREEAEERLFSIVTASLLKPEHFASSKGASSRPNPLASANLSEAEIDPIRVASADAKWIVFVRKVWWGGDRFLQGFVVSTPEFFESLQTTVRNPTDALEEGTCLILYQDTPLFGCEADRMFSWRAHAVSTLPLSSPMLDFALKIGSMKEPVHPASTLFLLLAGVLSLALVGGLFGTYRVASKAVELTQKKSDFISAVSHELKTPLTSIRMYSEMLDRPWGEDPERRGLYLRYLREESDRLGRLIDNVLMLSRIEGREQRLELSRHDAETLFRSLVARLEPIVQRAGFEFESRAEIEARTLLVNEDAAFQVLANLIENALKFSKDAALKRINMSLALEGNQCLLRIRDFGPGIPVKERRKIFGRFYRAETELTRVTPGAGIGLALVTRLAELMGGRIDVGEVHPGAEFILRVPAYSA